MLCCMYDRPTRAHLAACLADAFLAGAWNEERLVSRAGQALEPPPRWSRPVVRQVLAAYHRPPADRPRELASFVALALEGPSAQGPPPRVRRWFVPPLAMGRRRWPVPELSSVGELAGLFELSHGELDWLADVRGIERSVTAERLRNYRYTWLARQDGPPRLIERPKARLKAVQRRLLHDVLDWIPAHDAAHGFTRGRSAKSHAAAHTGRRVVLRMDLEDFFASVAAGRTYGIFRTAGYPEPVAHVLAGLTTNVVPAEEWDRLPRPGSATMISAHHRLSRRVATPHLPQGAPTSPAIANLCAFRLDRRLSGLARAFGATYTRYADDLVFSGTRRIDDAGGRLCATVGEIVREEGFTVNERKSSLVTRAGRQCVCGIVVNERLNVSRREYDQLKAVLHNAGRHGAQSQNRAGVADFRMHLLGRVAWVASLNPGRGERLRRLLAGIDWDS